MKKIIVLITSLFLSAVLLSGCSGNASKTDGTQTKTTDSKTSAAVKIGILSDVDSLPFILAEQEGYFKDEGVNVELQKFKSAAERDSALQSRNIDGAVSDMLAAIFATDGGFDVRITSHTDGKYIFLASSQSGAKSIPDLKDKDIGLSTNTIIEYSVDAMLKAQGMRPDDVNKVAIAQMPVRLEMLKSGKISGACLPEPLATQAKLDGAIPVGDTDASGSTLGIMLFSKSSIDQKKAEIQKVYNAYEKAKTELNNNGDKYKAMLVQQAGFPNTVKDAIEFPKYRKSFIPSEDDFGQVYSWLKSKGLIKKDIDYSSMVTEEFIK